MIPTTRPHPLLVSSAPARENQATDRFATVVLLQLRILAAAVVRVGGTSLMLPSPSRPSENEAKPGDWMEEQTCEQSEDIRNAEYAGCDQAQAARATGLLSFAL